jgi:DNA-binding MarR family transcriptional regulator
LPRAEVEALYQGLSRLVRRSREFGPDIHGGLSLVDYTLLTEIHGAPGTRAADLAILFGLDKSTVSRQVIKLVEVGLLARTGERPGQRGVILELTAAGERALAGAAQAVRAALGAWLADWDDDDIGLFAGLVDRLNQRMADDRAAGVPRPRE